jgi:hypothetical protein
MKKTTSVFSIILLIFSMTSNLLAGGSHECVKEDPDHCAMPLKKMDCCPAEQQANSCNCAEMNRNSNQPRETSPVVLLTSDINNFGKYITLQFDLINPESQYQQYFNPSDTDFGIIDNSKKYILIHTFLI